MEPQSKINAFADFMEKGIGGRASIAAIPGEFENP